MKTALLMLVLCASWASAYTIDVEDKDGTPLSTVAWTMREGGPRAYTGFYVTTSDSSSQTFSMAVTSGSGNEVAVTTAGGCTNYPAACSGRSYSGTPFIFGIGTHKVVGVGTPSYTLRFTDASASNSPVDITFNATIAANSMVTTFTSPGAESNCSNSHGDYPCDDTCTVSDWRPDQTSFSAPGVGSSYVDGTFGSTVTQLCNDCRHPYSALSAFNADSTKVYLYDQATSVRRVVDLNGNVKVNDVPGGAFWDAVDPTVYYYCSIDGSGELTKVTLNYGAGTFGEAVLVDFTSDFGSGEDCNNGGTGDTSSNNWMALRSKVLSGGAFGGDLCVVNLTTLDYTCKDISGISQPFTSVDFPLISKGVDSTSGKMYAVLTGDPRMGIWSFTVGASPSLTLEARGGGIYKDTVDYDGSTCTSSCLQGGHSDTYEDDQGNQYWVTLEFITGAMVVGGNFAVAHLLRAGDDMRVPIEANGGANIFWLASKQGDTSQSQHTGCAKDAPYCYISLRNPNYLTSYDISDATNASPIKITTTAAHGYITDDKVNIGGVVGNTAANGVWTVTLVDADEFTLNTSTGNGAYTSGGVVGSGEALSWYPYRHQQVVIRLGSTEEIRRVAVHRTQDYTKPSGYWYTPRGCMSPDGTKILWDTSFGLPTDLNVVFAETGVAASGVATTEVAGRATVGGGASVH